MKKFLYPLVVFLVFCAVSCRPYDSEVKIAFKNSDMTYDAVDVSLNTNKKISVKKGETKKLGYVKAGETFNVDLIREDGYNAGAANACNTIGKDGGTITVNWKGGMDFSCE